MLNQICMLPGWVKLSTLFTALQPNALPEMCKARYIDAIYTIPVVFIFVLMHWVLHSV